MSVGVGIEGFHFQLALSASCMWLRCDLAASCSGSLLSSHPC